MPQLGSPPQTGPSKFLTTQARQIKDRWKYNMKKLEYLILLRFLQLLINSSIFILHSRGSDGGALIFDELSSPAYTLTIFQVFRLMFDFFPLKFATFSKPPSRDNYCKASYPRTQQRHQGAGWTQIMRSGSICWHQPLATKAKQIKFIA